LRQHIRGWFRRGPVARPIVGLFVVQASRPFTRSTLRDADALCSAVRIKHPRASGVGGVGGIRAMRMFSSVSVEPNVAFPPSQAQKSLLADRARNRLSPAVAGTLPF